MRSMNWFREDERAGGEFLLQGADAANGDDCLGAEAAERVDVGPVVHPVGRDRLAGTVAGEEEDLDPRDGAGLIGPDGAPDGVATR